MTDAATILAVVPNVVPKRLHSSRCALGEERRNIWYITPDGDTSYQDLFNPEYWGFVSAKFRTYDRIEVIPDDDSYFAELIVLSAGRSLVEVAELRKVALPERGVARVNMEYDAKWSGPHSKWRIFRKSDGAVIKDGFETQEMARTEIALNYSRVR